MYSVYFGNGKAYFSDYPEFCEDVFTFGFDRISVHAGPHPDDILIRCTIIQLISDFLYKHTDKALFFVCDSVDKRGISRMRLFERWCRINKIPHLEKHNTSILSPDMELYASIMLHGDHPLKDYVIRSFHHLSRNTAEKLKSY
ncbi:DUF6169 family protein [Chitinophaga vietnamensis]|uniref:DUF6169 family protein n=1 Tax=Chitinophaga vietnamensis TaxID=2593957 RepID=UPI001F21291E|nr:DUF6169 family protein [Chitinophaga vietnamensis]